MSGYQDPIPASRFGAVNLVEALSSAQHMPLEALELALQSPARIAEPVLALAARAADGASLDERERNLLFWGIHVLGACRDPRLYGPLLRTLRLPADTVGELLGDAIAGTMPRVVASVFDGEAEPLLEAIADREADEFVRWGLFGALAFLTAESRIAREATHALLVRFDDERPARAGDAAWTGWEQTIALLGLRDLAPRVERARADARLLDDTADPEWFDLTLADAEARPDDRRRFDDLDLGYVEDPIGELEAALAGDEDEPGDPAEPIRNPLREIGRNDPCPCGSGKKYKKCCLAA